MPPLLVPQYLHEGLAPTRLRTATDVVAIVNVLAHGTEREWRAAVRAALPKGAGFRERRVAGFEAVRAAAADAVRDGADLIISVGGDGTANACINGIGASRTSLAVVPAGTANDLARIVGQPRDLDDAVAGVREWRTRKMDAVTVNGHRFLSAGGLGFAADAAALANRWRTGQCLRTRMFRRIGAAVYTLAAAMVILFRRRLGATFTVDYVDAKDGKSGRLEVDGYGVVVANAGQLGKDLHLTDDARVDDGVFELLLFPRMGRGRLLRCLFKARTRRLLEERRIEMLRVRWARVSADRRVRFFGDGEVLARGDDFVLGIEPGAARVMGPRRGRAASAGLPKPHRPSPACPSFRAR